MTSTTHAWNFHCGSFKLQCHVCTTVNYHSAIQHSYKYLHCAIYGKTGMVGAGRSREYVWRNTKPNQTKSPLTTGTRKHTDNGIKDREETEWQQPLLGSIQMTGKWAGKMCKMVVHVCAWEGGIAGQTPSSGEPWGTLMWLRSDHLSPLSPGLVTGNFRLSLGLNGKPKTSTRKDKEAWVQTTPIIKTSLHWPHGMYRPWLKVLEMRGFAKLTHQCVIVTWMQFTKIDFLMKELRCYWL